MLFMPRLMQISDRAYDAANGFDVVASIGVCGDYRGAANKRVIVVPSHVGAGDQVVSLTELRQMEGGYIGGVFDLSDSADGRVPQGILPLLRGGGRDAFSIP